MSQREDIVVTIEVDKGQLTVKPTVIHLIRGDNIQFTAKGKPFAVLAKGLSPLNKTYIRGKRGKSTETARIIDEAAGGTYSFACAIYDDDGQIYMDAGCPEFVYDPGSGGSS